MTIYFKPRVGIELDMYCNKVMRHFITESAQKMENKSLPPGRIRLGWEAAGQAMCHFEWTWKA